MSLAALVLTTHRFFQRHFDFASSSFAGLPSASMVHQDLAHQPRRHSKEMRAVLPVGARLIDESQVGLMDKRRWLQRVALAFFPQVAGCKLTKFPVDERSQLIEGLLVTLRPFGQQQRHFMGDRSAHVVESDDLNQWSHYTPDPWPELRQTHSLQEKLLCMPGFRPSLRMSQ